MISRFALKAVLWGKKWLKKFRQKETIREIMLEHKIKEQKHSKQKLGKMYCFLFPFELYILQLMFKAKI